jgi:uncharacterized membrane protein
MWIIGLLIGLVIGGYIDDIEGAIVGAALGAIAGLLISLFRRNSTLNNLLERVGKLEEQLADLQRQLATARVAPPEAASVASEAATPIAEPTPSEPEAPPQPTASETPPVPALQAEARTAETLSAPAEREPPGPPEPPAGMDALTRLWDWLTGGNALVRVGVVVLFFGVAFLLKYAYEHTNVPIELRLTGVAIGAIVMLVIGWRLRTRKPVCCALANRCTRSRYRAAASVCCIWLCSVRSVCSSCFPAKPLSFC